MEPKVLFVGNVRDGTGYSVAGANYVLALDRVGVDVVYRNIKLNNEVHELPPRILELEKKSSSGCNVVVQHSLPHHFVSDSRLVNVGLFAWETSSFRTSSWADRLNLMDAVWVVNRQQADACKSSGVKRPVYVAPHTCDTSRYERSYEPFGPLAEYRRRGDFLFYTIGEFSRRKNLAALVKAFHIEFDPDEPVQLVIKASVPGRTPTQAAVELQKICQRGKDGLKLRANYKDEILVTERHTDEQVMSLHDTCSCGVFPSRGEAWCQPAFDSMAMGKTPIVTNWGGFQDYLNNDCGWLVDCRLEPVFGMNESFGDLYTGKEDWAEIDCRHLASAMREAFEDRSKREDRAARGISRAYQFDYDTIGSRLKKELTSYVQKATESGQVGTTA